MATPMLGGLFSRFWKRFGENKQLNFAKAIAETIARRLSIPIANSKYIATFHKQADKLFGKQFSEMGEDVITVIAKVLLHAPDKLILFLSQLTGKQPGAVSIVVNQFLDQLAEGIIVNFNDRTNSVPEANEIVQAVADVEEEAAKVSGIDELAIKYGWDSKLGVFHYLSCDELYEYVTVKDDSAGDPKDKGGKKGSKKVKQLKDRIRVLTLGEAIDFGLDPFAFRPKCCGGVLVHSPNTRDELNASKPQTMAVCLSKMGDEGVALDERLQTVCGALWTELLTNPQQALIATLDFEELRDYLLRPLWTPELARQFFINWNPEIRATLFLKLSYALEILRRIAPPKARPEAKKPSWIDKWIEKICDAAVQYAKGENAPLLHAVETRVDKYSDEMHEGNEELKGSVEYGLDALEQGL